MSRSPEYGQSSGDRPKRVISGRPAQVTPPETAKDRRIISGRPAQVTPPETAPEHGYQNGWPFPTWLKKQISAAVKGTFAAIIKRGVELTADAHGLGPLLRGAEWVWTAVKWMQVGKEERGINFGTSILLGSRVELDLSAQTELSPDEPPITACFAPACGPDPGVLVINGLQISPGDRQHEDSAEQPGKVSAGDADRAIFVSVDLSALMSEELSQPIPGRTISQTRSAAFVYLTKTQLVPVLKRQRVWDALQMEGAEYVICYDSMMRVSIWLVLSGVEARPDYTRITFDTVGRLKFHVQ